jgi:hypothetical protein
MMHGLLLREIGGRLRVTAHATSGQSSGEKGGEQRLFENHHVSGLSIV